MNDHDKRYRDGHLPPIPFTPIEPKADPVLPRPRSPGRTTNLPRMMMGKHVGQVWSFTDGTTGTIIDSGSEGGWIIQPSQDGPTFWVAYDSKTFHELIHPLT